MWLMEHCVSVWNLLQSLLIHSDNHELRFNHHRCGEVTSVGLNYSSSYWMDCNETDVHGSQRMNPQDFDDAFVLGWYLLGVLREIFEQLLDTTSPLPPLPKTLISYLYSYQSHSCLFPSFLPLGGNLGCGEGVDEPTQGFSKCRHQQQCIQSEHQSIYQLAGDQQLLVRQCSSKHKLWRSAQALQLCHWR